MTSRVSLNFPLLANATCRAQSGQNVPLICLTGASMYSVFICGCVAVAFRPLMPINQTANPVHDWEAWLDSELWSDTISRHEILYTASNVPRPRHMRQSPAWHCSLGPPPARRLYCGILQSPLSMLGIDSLCSPTHLAVIKCSKLKFSFNYDSALCIYGAMQNS